MQPQEDGIFFEIRVIGNSVKATAIDSKTGIEACIIAPRHTPMFSLKENAKRKLKYVMEKKGEE